MYNHHGFDVTIVSGLVIHTDELFIWCDKAIDCSVKLIPDANSSLCLFILFFK